MPKAIRRIVRKQLDKVLAHLNAPGENRDEAIHDARSRFKKVRSLLRLVRGEIGGKACRRENACYREAGRRLSALRDAAVVTQTLGQLVKRSSGRISPADCAEFRRALRMPRSHRLAVREQVLAEAAESIEAARRRVAKWPLESNDFSALRGGLEDTYRSGRKSLARAYADATDRIEEYWHSRHSVRR